MLYYPPRNFSSCLPWSFSLTISLNIYLQALRKRVEVRFIFSDYYSSLYPSRRTGSHLPIFSNLISHYSLGLLFFRLNRINFLSPVQHFWSLWLICNAPFGTFYIKSSVQNWAHYLFEASSAGLNRRIVLYVLQTLGLCIQYRWLLRRGAMLVLASSWKAGVHKEILCQSGSFTLILPTLCSLPLWQWTSYR